MRRLAQGPVGEGLDHLLGLVRGVDGGHRALVEVEVLRVDDHVDVGQAPELAQLQRGELDLRRPPTGEHVHVSHRVALDRPVHALRDIGPQQVVRALGEHPGDVERDVARTNHRYPFGLQRPLTRHVRVAVVPGHEVGRPEGAGQLDAGDGQRRVPDRAGGEHHGVVVPPQVSKGDVGADVDVAQQADVAALEDLVQRQDDLLDPRVVRRDAVAHQPERDGQAFDQVDADVEAGLGQDVGCVDAGRTRADDSYPRSTAAHRLMDTFPGRQRRTTAPTIIAKCRRGKNAGAQRRSGD